MSTLTALGDSFSCGEGVGVKVLLNRTWAAALADALGLDLAVMAAPGARLRDVLERQLRHMPYSHVATVFVGLNDVCRGGFDSTIFGADLTALVEAMSWRAEHIVLVRLHDPTRHVWLPRRLKNVVRRRLAAANAAIDQVTVSAPKVRMLDADLLPAWRRRAAWAVDGVHPTAYGHSALAAAAAVMFGLEESAQCVAPSGSRGAAARHAWWILRHGAPYAVRHAGAFAKPVGEGLRRAG